MERRRICGHEKCELTCMKTFTFLLVCFLPLLFEAQPNYDSLSKQLITSRGLVSFVTKEIDTIKLIEKLLDNYGSDNCLNSTWGGFTDCKDAYNLMVRSSSNRVSDYGLTINRISALYLISSLFYSDTLFTGKIELVLNNKESKKYIDGVDVLFPKERPYNESLLYINNCDRYGGFSTKLKDIKLVNKAVDLYRRWFNLLKYHGISYMREHNIFPLKGSNIYWEEKK